MTSRNAPLNTAYPRYKYSLSSIHHGGCIIEPDNTEDRPWFVNARSKICRANPGGHKSMRTATNTGSEQGTAAKGSATFDLHLLAASNHKNRVAPSLFTGSREIYRSLCLLFGGPGQSTLSWDYERSSSFSWYLKQRTYELAIFQKQFLT